MYWFFDPLIRILIETWTINISHDHDTTRTRSNVIDPITNQASFRTSDPPVKPCAHIFGTEKGSVSEKPDHHLQNLLHLLFQRHRDHHRSPVHLTNGCQHSVPFNSSSMFRTRRLVLNSNAYLKFQRLSAEYSSWNNGQWPTFSSLNQ